MKLRFDETVDPTTTEVLSLFETSSMLGCSRVTTHEYDVWFRRSPTRDRTAALERMLDRLIGDAWRSVAVLTPE